MKTVITQIASRSKYILGILGATIAGGILAGSAIAAIPDSSGTIHGCYKTAKGDLRIIDSPGEQCSGSETALSWNTLPGLHKASYAFEAPLNSIPASNPQVMITIPGFGNVEATCDNSVGAGQIVFHNTTSSTIYTRDIQIAPGESLDTIVSGQFFKGAGAQTESVDIYAWASAEGEPVNKCFFQARAIY